VQHLKQTWSIACGHHYPAVWSWEAFAGLDYDKGDTPITQDAAERVISLPLFPSTSAEDVDYIAHALKETVATLNR
jgi:dTDP-4-amino-4,6-dideoxygalactose transaminase